jgi:hypothetical protein
MDAEVGDRLVVEGEKVGQGRRTGEIVGVQGGPARRQLWVRWEDGHQSLFIPGPGARIERP